MSLPGRQPAPPRKRLPQNAPDWRAARIEMERGRYEDIDLRYRNGDLTFSEAVDLKAKVPDEVSELVRHSIAVTERAD